MKNFVRSGSLLLAFLCPALLAERAGATVVWTAGFESNKSGDVCSSSAANSEFKPGINETKGGTNAVVLGEHVYTGNLACRITVDQTDTFGQYNQDRVDIQHPSTLTGEGKDSWLSGHYFMPADAKMRNEIGFYETKNTSSNVIDFWVAPKTGGGTTLSFGVGFLGATVLWTGDFTIGKWHQIAVHVKWSQMATVGAVDFWLDGQQVVTNHAFKTKPDGNDLFFQTGLHRITPMNFTDVIYFDDFIEADTLADAKIAAANPNGGGSATDGGAGASGGAGAGGAAGSGGTAGAGGSNATGAGGGSATGAAGSASTGAAGASAAGAAGSGGGTHAKSGGCSLAGGTSRGGLALAVLAILGAIVARRRRS